MLNADWRQATNVGVVEDMIRGYDDFLTTLMAQEDKMERLKQLTLVERALDDQVPKAGAVTMKREEAKRIDPQKKDQIRTVEKHKILQVPKSTHYIWDDVHSAIAWLRKCPYCYWVFVLL